MQLSKDSRFIVFAVMFCLSGLWQQDASARIILKEKTSYYTVTGSTGKELYASMLRKGPKLKEIRGHVLAATKFEYGIINMKTAISGKYCVPESFDIVLNVEYIYPRWGGSKQATSATKSAWRNFSKTAVWHEKQHVKLSMEYARSFEKILKKLKSRISSNCSQTSFGHKWRATSAARKSNRLHKRFDRKDLGRSGRGYKALIALIRAN